VAKTKQKLKIEWFAKGWIHVLWTVPTALAVGVPIWFVFRWTWCGLGGCLHSSSGWFAPKPEFPELDLVIVFVIFALIPLFLAIAIPPWIKPVWLRLIGAVILLLMEIYFLGWGANALPFLPTFDVIYNFLTNE